MTEPFRFPTVARRPYTETVDLYRRGFLTCGFLWALARDDEVFAAYLRRLTIPME